VASEPCWPPPRAICQLYPPLAPASDQTRSSIAYKREPIPKAKYLRVEYFRSAPFRAKPDRLPHEQALELNSSRQVSKRVIVARPRSIRIVLPITGARRAAAVRPPR